ncbi:hypothetical protein [Micromonospora siamensis]|uniref:hypothetical protein n=1 Tax=Micromonospora siamensis TaxID=299152 RepID=UPI0018D573BD|nr:hypothetical protein [Micromonospora siamensis]
MPSGVRPLAAQVRTCRHGASDRAVGSAPGTRRANGHGAINRPRRRWLAAGRRDQLNCSYALRNLCFAAHAAGRVDEARLLLEESTRLRREVGFLPGVAANLVGLARLAVDEGRPDDATALAA